MGIIVMWQLLAVFVAAYLINRAVIRPWRIRSARNLSLPPTMTRDAEASVPFVQPQLRSNELRARFPYARVAVIDTETTGLNSSDRIATLAIYLLDCSSVAAGVPQVKTKHLVFDPMKKSHPQAQAVHGLDDWMLRHQPMFVEHLNEIRDFLSQADAYVGHNINFDIRYLEREFDLCGEAFPSRPVFCTMKHAKTRYDQCNLKYVSAQYGLSRQRSSHSAAEDAWLTMMIYIGIFSKYPVKTQNYLPIPFDNFAKVPPRPIGELPRRSNTTKLKAFRARSELTRSETQHEEES
jgi:DNA polymerase III subunit epsilon